MDDQLTGVIEELRAAQDRVHALNAALPAPAWYVRPAADRWSAAECLVHVNMTSAALIPLLRRGLEEARGLRERRGRYRRNFVGWLVSKAIAPYSRLRLTTIEAFVPEVTEPLGALLREFDRLQDEIVACVEAGRGLALDDVFLISPFHARVRYNVYAAMTLIPRHQQRHLRHAVNAIAACDGLVPTLVV